VMAAYILLFFTVLQPGAMLVAWLKSDQVHADETTTSPPPPHLPIPSSPLFSLSGTCGRDNHRRFCCAHPSKQWVRRVDRPCTRSPSRAVPFCDILPADTGRGCCGLCRYFPPVARR
jgi:hypothetical protein